jgi:hypothetical protein
MTIVTTPHEGGAAAADPAAASSLPLRVEIRDGDDDLGALERDWLRLANDMPGAMWCMLPAAFRVWNRTMRRGGAVRLITVFDSGGELCGLMPVVLSRAWRGPSCVPRFDYVPWDRASVTGHRPRPIPVRQNTPMASIPATMLWVGVLCRPGLEQPVYSAVAGELAGLAGWDALVMPAFAAKDQDLWIGAWRGLGLSPRVHQLSRVVLNLRGVRAFAEIVAANRSQKFRQNVRRAQTAATKAGIEFVVEAGKEAFARWREPIARIAAASWKDQGRKGTEVSIPYRGPQQDFFEVLMADPNLGGEPVIGVARVRGDPLCVLLALRHSHNLTALLTFRDDRFPEASPGLLLFGAIIDWCAERGIVNFEMNATHSWLRHLANSKEEVNNVVTFAPGWRGRGLAFIADLAQRRS